MENKGNKKIAVKGKQTIKQKKNVIQKIMKKSKREIKSNAKKRERQ